MSFDADRLFELLPAIHRLRDADEGGPLRALLEVAARQSVILEENLAQLYDDQFVETCAPWVLPYIGDLLGITGLPGEELDPRAEVAHTIAYRRRKGTAAMVEQLAQDVSGLPARAVEFFQILATTQYLNHRRLENLSFLSLRNAVRLERLGGAFEHLDGYADLTHNVDVRRLTAGRYNIPNVGVFLWRLQAYRLTDSPAVPDPSTPTRRFRFSPLGNDLQLFNLPRTEDEFTHLAEPVNVPEPISRRTMDALRADYYGTDRSILVEAGGSDVPLADIIVCDLSEWKRPPAGKVAVDPVLGRLAFPTNQSKVPRVTFHYGFSDELGGGEYNRSLLSPAPDPLLRVAMDGTADFTTIQDALDALEPQGGTVEVADSGRYEESLSIPATGRQVVLRAAEGARPTVVLGSDLTITGGISDGVTLDGLLLAGAAVVAEDTGGIGHLRIRHCTLVPGRSLDEDGDPTDPTAPSLVVNATNASVEIEASIVGGIQAVIDAKVHIVHSIVDATDPGNLAYGAPTGSAIPFGAPLTIEESTVFGRVRADALELASNTIFLADAPEPVTVRRRQEGCARFSYLPPGSVTPRRYRCRPRSAAEAARVRPMLSSTRYGEPAYAQLAVGCPDEIRRGADDESEMGAFHDRYLPLREAHLRSRLEESLRFGLEAGILYAT